MALTSFFAQVQSTVPQICGMVTNKLHDGEETNTIACVLHVASPGALNYTRIVQQTGDPADVPCDINEGHAQNPEDGPRKLTLIKALAVSRLVAAQVALFHRSGSLPFRVPAVTAAFSNWMVMMVKHHTQCVFNNRVAESFGRIRVRPRVLPFMRDIA